MINDSSTGDKLSLLREMPQSLANEERDVVCATVCPRLATIRRVRVLMIQRKRAFPRVPGWIPGDFSLEYL